MLSVLICDDSLVARKQVAKCLPQDLNGSVNFAKHGAEAITAILDSRVDVLLLDLNMPVLDGYGTLQQIQELELGTKTIVVSGDIQSEAKERVKALGALDFIHKPVDSEELIRTLQKHNLLEPPKKQHKQELKLDELVRDCYQEVVNVAMGQAGSHLAKIMDMFVKLPIPNVSLIEVSELHMMLSDIDETDRTSGVCQGFLGDGISGEALLMVTDSSFEEVAKLLKITEKVDDQLQLELLMDLASLLIGTCLTSIAQQLDMHFRQGHPVVLGQHQSVQDLISSNKSSWSKTLAIEISYGIDGYDIRCDLVLLFTEDSMDMMNAKLAHLME